MLVLCKWPSTTRFFEYVIVVTIWCLRTNTVDLPQDVFTTGLPYGSLLKKHLWSVSAVWNVSSWSESVNWTMWFVVRHQNGGGGGCSVKATDCWRKCHSLNAVDEGWMELPVEWRETWQLVVIAPPPDPVVVRVSFLVQPLILFLGLLPLSSSLPQQPSHSISPFLHPANHRHCREWHHHIHISR